MCCALDMLKHNVSYSIQVFSFNISNKSLNPDCANEKSCELGSPGVSSRSQGMIQDSLAMKSLLLPLYLSRKGEVQIEESPGWIQAKSALST